VTSDYDIENRFEQFLRHFFVPDEFIVCVRAGDRLSGVVRHMSASIASDDPTAPYVDINSILEGIKGRLVASPDDDAVIAMEGRFEGFTCHVSIISPLICSAVLWQGKK
jgi:hypothetical protein